MYNCNSNFLLVVKLFKERYLILQQNIWKSNNISNEQLNEVKKTICRYIFQAQDDLSKQLQVMKSMLYGAETSTSSSASSANQVTDQQSDIVLAQLSQVSKTAFTNDVTQIYLLC